ncbi:MAG TPA: aldo/keto reductase, partial [Candidatus Hydrogenedentes bacterium]|nr:aldo/keto reductase [Candidatus Hydrogenedentota bacterium]
HVCQPMVMMFVLPRAADDRQNAVIRKMYWTDENMRKGQELAALARALGASAAELALAWCLRNRHVSSVILGASNVAQLDQNLRAAELHIPDDVMAKLDALYPVPETAPQI